MLYGRRKMRKDDVSRLLLLLGSPLLPSLSVSSGTSVCLSTYVVVRKCICSERERERQASVRKEFVMAG